jgi:nitrogen fixation protein NifX
LADGEEKEERIVARAAALEGCTLVYTAQIGGPAAAKLVRRHIQPVKVAENAVIAEAILQLQQVLKDKPAPWLRKAMNASNPDSPITT